MALEHLLVVGWGEGGWNREKLRDIPICCRRITFITPRKPIPRTRMEGKNCYCVVKCVINEQCNRWSLSFCRAIKMRELAWKSPPTNAEV